jgi:hypothetical protein
METYWRVILIAAVTGGRKKALNNQIEFLNDLVGDNLWHGKLDPR